MPGLTERSARVVGAAKLHRHVAASVRASSSLRDPIWSRPHSAAVPFGRSSPPTRAATRFATLLAGIDVPVHGVTDRAAKALSDTVTPVGLVAVCDAVAVSLRDVVAARPRLVVVAVDLSEPGNAGTLIRTRTRWARQRSSLPATASTHTTPSVCARRPEAFSCFRCRRIRCSGRCPELSEAGLRLFATTLDGEVSLDAADLSEPTAWLFGSEAHGLAPRLAALADARVRIPMPGGTESLNVAAAAAICLYQSAHAQRDENPDALNRA